MLEIIVISLMVVGGVLLLRRRAEKKNSAPEKPAVYVCDRCGETDCHCEQRP